MKEIQGKFVMDVSLLYAILLHELSLHLVPHFEECSQVVNVNMWITFEGIS
jgi:hypothetical protein